MQAKTEIGNRQTCRLDEALYLSGMHFYHQWYGLTASQDSTTSCLKYGAAQDNQTGVWHAVGCRRIKAKRRSLTSMDLIVFNYKIVSLLNECTQV